MSSNSFVDVWFEDASQELSLTVRTVLFSGLLWLCRRRHGIWKKRIPIQSVLYVDYAIKNEKDEQDIVPESWILPEYCLYPFYIFYKYFLLNNQLFSKDSQYTIIRCMQHLLIIFWISIIFNVSYFNVFVYKYEISFVLFIILNGLCKSVTCHATHSRDCMVAVFFGLSFININVAFAVRMSQICLLFIMFNAGICKIYNKERLLSWINGDSLKFFFYNMNGLQSLPLFVNTLLRTNDILLSISGIVSLAIELVFPMLLAALYYLQWDNDDDYFFICFLIKLVVVIGFQLFHLLIQLTLVPNFYEQRICYIIFFHKELKFIENMIFTSNIHAHNCNNFRVLLTFVALLVLLLNLFAVYYQIDLYPLSCFPMYCQAANIEYFKNKHDPYYNVHKITAISFKSVTHKLNNNINNDYVFTTTGWSHHWFIIKLVLINDNNSALIDWPWHKMLASTKKVIPPTSLKRWNARIAIELRNELIAASQNQQSLCLYDSKKDVVYFRRQSKHVERYIDGLKHVINACGIVEKDCHYLVRLSLNIPQ